MNLAPRMAANEIALLRSASRASERILEFGCGGSTLLFVCETKAQIDSVESDKKWLANVDAHEAIQHALSDGRLHLHHADIGPVKAWGAPQDNHSMSRWPTYWMHVWKSAGVSDVDLVFVDGRFRVACTLSTLVWGRAKPTVAFHDFFNRRRYHVVLEFFDVQQSAATLAVLRPKKEIDSAALLERLVEHAFVPG